MGKPSKNSPKRLEASLEGNRGLDQWAKSLVASLGKKAARSILADYEAVSKDSKVTKASKAIARKRALALRKRM